MLNDFISLIFPQVCASCGNSLYKNEQTLCTYCVYHLPKTNFHLNNDNPVAKIFWGRVDIQSAAAFYGFNKGGRVQHIIHQLKYKGRKEVGFAVGKLYGYELKMCDSFKTVDTIIPVPLHSKKIKKRGYNQSEAFAEGLSVSMGVPANVKTLFRAYESETQTKKSRFSRWQNVESIFQLKDIKSLEGKHVLLVDDVVTTGATLEACAQTLQQIPGIKISVATIAYASN
ncbi:MAG: ComF family protein [Bacteroidetes bacterium]|nr:ComF family protein [Bacteroidota bacterium]